MSASKRRSRRWRPRIAASSLISGVFTAPPHARRRPVSTAARRVSHHFAGDEAVLGRDNLKIAFRVHTVWRIDDAKVPLFMDRFSTTVTNDVIEKDPDAIVKVAYANFIREPLRTYARDEVQRRNGMDAKEALMPIGEAVLQRIRAYATDSPFVITDVVVGNGLHLPGVHALEDWRRVPRGAPIEFVGFGNQDAVGQGDESTVGIHNGLGAKVAIDRSDEFGGIHMAVIAKHPHERVHRDDRHAGLHAVA